jgi:hypothetical protein
MRESNGQLAYCEMGGHRYAIVTVSRAKAGVAGYDALSRSKNSHSLLAVNQDTERLRIPDHT